MTKLFYSLLFLSLTSVVSWAQCIQVVRLTDKQADRVVIQSTSVGSYWTEPVQFKQVSEKGVTQFFIQLYALGGSLMDQKGAIVFFTDGTVLAWPEAKVKADGKGTAHVSQCLLELTENEIEQFQDKQIVRIKLSTQERALTLTQSQRAQDIINCVLHSQFANIRSDRLVNQQ